MANDIIKRIELNEERYDKIESIINELNDTLNKFKTCQKEFSLLNKYYGSKKWFKDKYNFEKNLIPKIKAGVLTEDAIWDLNDDIKEVISLMKSIVDEYNEKGD